MGVRGEARPEAPGGAVATGSVLAPHMSPLRQPAAHPPHPQETPLNPLPPLEQRHLSSAT